MDILPSNKIYRVEPRKVPIQKPAADSPMRLSPWFPGVDLAKRCSGARLGGVALATAPPTRDRLAVGVFPSLDEDEELEGPEQEPSSNHTMDSSSCEPGETPAPKSICESMAASEGTSSPQPQMPTSNMSGMITMSVADLLAFCQQMTCQNASNINNDTSVNDFKSQIHEYQKNYKGLNL
ncbi:hypothetical protein PAAG_11081 [Paracoccidioides lutzii Pb01]|uniref:Uncharacterized protein n=1 Tax=Paracoccidioides lutzii (strain ATCC MYA-826 / Pb01) TaxID=502779 RepID=A0A0A2V7S7_PARBA|nr:hypothetical protein PAAG_11081 [Paracoccidioides lutzii Pb01]KGQ02130.1 hypothetical protein PAAG_11081 [Paracoccidioides lutzii Pb01]